MKTSETFNKSVQLLGASLLGYFFLSFLANSFGLTDYWSPYDGRDTTKFVIQFILHSIPFSLVWIFIGFDEKNREAARMALLSFLGGSLLILIYQVIDPKGGLGGWTYMLYILNLAVSLGIFGHFRFEKDYALKFAIVGLLLAGINYSFNAYTYFGKLEYWLSLAGFHDVFGRYNGGASLKGVLTEIYSITLYILQFFVITYFIRVFDNPKLWNWRLSKLELSNHHLDNLSFSILFWSFRIFVICLLANQLPDIYFWTDYNPIELKKILSFILQAAGIYVIVSIYRNFLIQETIKYGKAPSWQFIGLNIPIINIVVWIVKITSVQKEDVRGELDAGADLKAIDNQNGVNNSRLHYTRLKRNQGIRTLVIVLYLISIFYSFIIMINYSIMSEEVVMTFLLSSGISIGIVIWYFADYRAAHILLILVVVMVFILQFLAPQEYMHLATLGSMVNLILYYGLFHFDEMKILGEENPPTVESKTAESDDILDV